jgi:hypothetical protein
MFFSLVRPAWLATVFFTSASPTRESPQCWHWDAHQSARIAPGHVTTVENVGRAMIGVAAHGYSKRVLENTDINLVSAAA